MDDCRGYSIRVAVYPDQDGVTFHATYTILCAGKKVACGTVAGGLRTIADAEREAEQAASRWVDEQRHWNH